MTRSPKSNTELSKDEILASYNVPNKSMLELAGEKRKKNPKRRYTGRRNTGLNVGYTNQYSIYFYAKLH